MPGGRVAPQPSGIAPGSVAGRSAASLGLGDEERAPPPAPGAPRRRRRVAPGVGWKPRGARVAVPSPPWPRIGHRSVRSSPRSQAPAPRRRRRPFRPRSRAPAPLAALPGGPDNRAASALAAPASATASRWRRARSSGEVLPFRLLGRSGRRAPALARCGPDRSTLRTASHASGVRLGAAVHRMAPGTRRRLRAGWCGLGLDCQTRPSCECSASMLRRRLHFSKYKRISRRMPSAVATLCYVNDHGDHCVLGSLVLAPRFRGSIAEGRNQSRSAAAALAEGRAVLARPF